MTLEMALLLFFGLAILAGAVIYFGLGLNRTADQIETITQSPVGGFILGLGQ